MTFLTHTPNKTKKAYFHLDLAQRPAAVVRWGGGFSLRQGSLTGTRLDLRYRREFSSLPWQEKPGNLCPLSLLTAGQPHQEAKFCFPPLDSSGTGDADEDTGVLKCGDMEPSSKALMYQQ